MYIFPQEYIDSSLSRIMSSQRQSYPFATFKTKRNKYNILAEYKGLNSKKLNLIKLGGLLSTPLNKKIELDIYSDEVFNGVDPFDNTNWMYLGALFVPTDCKTEVLKNLNDLRCIKSHNWNAVSYTHLTLPTNREV